MLKKDKVDKKVYAVAQEIKLTKLLAGNNKKVREKTLRNLQKWFKFREATTPLKEADFMRIWKGLFYSMWMSDKPLVQEECAENIAKLVHFDDPTKSVLFFKCGLYTLSMEWFGIDHLRLDKFLMLVRRLMRQGFEICRRHDWQMPIVRKFCRALQSTVFDVDSCCALGLVMHVTDVYLEELAKVSDDRLDERCVVELLRPFVFNLANNKEKTQIRHVLKHVFRYLMWQSDAGIDYKERYAVWRQRRFAGGSIECVQKVDAPAADSDDEDYGQTLPPQRPVVMDPRAGSVDVVLPQIPFNVDDIIALFAKYKYRKGSTTAGRKALTALQSEFEQLAKGVFPLGVKELKVNTKSDARLNVRGFAEDLLLYEEKLMDDDDTNIKRTAKRKLIVTDEAVATKRTRKTVDADDDDDDDDDDATVVPRKHKYGEVIKKLRANDETSYINGRDFSERLYDKCSEFVMKKKKKMKKIPTILKDYPDVPECFVRSSGMWYVEDLGKLCADSPPVTPPSPVNGDDDPWNSPLQNGEVEFYMPASKCKRSVDELNDELNEVSIGTPKRRAAKQPKYLTTPGSNKKVKIALNLNRSQETSDYEKQLKASPAIPYDAERKPSKPLLKPNLIPSPINPFYKRKLRKSIA